MTCFRAISNGLRVSFATASDILLPFRKKIFRGVHFAHYYNQFPDKT
ncbi:Hypothetical protein NGK_0732 [Neisseria gonorrhoeae NCCP11945]|uniref:Uncharacterized protein n=1 Tax=Neisseria gonorrhoeae (strain NCCP11945) TaxID=521006 RepID=B4RKS2_NEIG2|nr:Hypothetical protein NGK_0732 [Neisseria gonorrhoeae NCCP11945]